MNNYTDSRELRLAICNCRSIPELNRIYIENAEFMDQHRYLYRVLSHHRKLLNRLRREKFAHTEIYEMN